jgi:small subunit ribosomal protein S16
MLIIRLQRTGKKNAADFRVVVAEKTAHASKKVNEVLGSYNPRRKTFQVNEERTKYWISQRTAMSPTMHNLLVTKGLLDAKKVKAFNTPKKPSEPAAAEMPAAEAPVEPTAEAATPAEAPPVAPAEPVAETASPEPKPEETPTA